MKRMISLIAIASILSLASFSKAPVAKGKTHCCLGNYIIEKAADPILVNGVALKSFVVSYDNSDMTVTIGIDNSDKKCTTYIVKSDDLTVQYDCKRQIFGVNRVNRKYLDDGHETSDKLLNRSEYFHQIVLTRNENSQLGYVKLISVFYPKLIKDYEKVFAVK